MVSSIYVVDNDSLVWCVQKVTEIKSINKIKWKTYMYHVNMLDLYSVCRDYARDYAKNTDYENWK